MKSTHIIIIYLGLFILDFLLDWFLDVLNINSSLKNRGRIPEAFKESVDEKTYRRSVEYTLRKGRFGLLSSLEGRALVLIVLFTGAAGALDSLLSSWHLPLYWHGLLFLGLSSAALGLAGLPSSLYSRFVIEEEFGFNTMSARDYFGDMLKQMPIGIVILMILLAGLYGALAWTGGWWWLAAWGFWMIFQLLMVVLYPLVIAPIFNKFEPLPEGSLKKRLSALAERCGFSNKGIFVMDGSRRSRHSNAYFTGLGKFRRIVIYDTLVESLGEEELEAVLAHEIGHWNFGHIRKRLMVSFISSLGMFALVGILLKWKPLFTAFGFTMPSLHALLFWLIFFSGPLTALISPLSNIWSRKHEYQADRFAVEQTENNQYMKGALLKLSKDNLSNMTPHPAYSFWHYSHPALSERLEALDSVIRQKV
ncbi:MAG: M48 family metallopeptidase [Spirochaetaceae bacterium]|nr:M48 family metallopeptidase [Spirochaetaceae bacterium]